METSFPRAEENYKVIEKLLAEPENKKCADCTSSVCNIHIYTYYIYQS